MGSQTTRRALFAASAALPLAALAVAPAEAAADPAVTRLERRLDRWLIKEAEFNARRGCSDEEVGAFTDAQKPAMDAAMALRGGDLATLRCKAKAVLLCNGGDLDLMRGERQYTDVALTGQILCALLGVA